MNRYDLPVMSGTRAVSTVIFLSKILFESLTGWDNRLFPARVILFQLVRDSG